ncbi:TetR/AcrR family transcriptional regulator [Microtetraspora sp. NBRC 16547]|uniref:TetR/AcrR family transcriptional regulator n=1 Tax=Microtetraspora sp. NBRC 16547 TaxID=3030993 RepID=UPI0024A5E9C8|nr:TetR/AcrR family transcriptional regulator [Microtetraspora sp. NBRC 16547]GLW98072.1 TetR family transcriptional regulator [Microtetraspora sp. NBRC 16547]
MTPTRDRIVAAAEQVIQELGLARATTKEIARAAGCSEALLYKHFRTKEEIFLAVLLERMPALRPATQRLGERVGQGTVAGNLEELAWAAVEFFRRTISLAGGMLSDPSLLNGFRQTLAESGGGPHVPIDLVASYLREEQRIGRVGPDANPDAASALLFGACFHRAFLANLVELAPDEVLVPDLVRTLLAGLTPR